MQLEAMMRTAATRRYSKVAHGYCGDDFAEVPLLAWALLPELAGGVQCLADGVILASVVEDKRFFCSTDGMRKPPRIFLKCSLKGFPHLGHSIQTLSVGSISGIQHTDRLLVHKPKCRPSPMRDPQRTINAAQARRSAVRARGRAARIFLPHGASVRQALL